MPAARETCSCSRRPWPWPWALPWWRFATFSWTGRWRGLSTSITWRRQRSCGWLANLSERLKDLAVVAIIAIVLWRIWKRAGRFQTVLLAIAANLVVTTAIKQLLKWNAAATGRRGGEKEIPH